MFAHAPAWRDAWAAAARQVADVVIVRSGRTKVKAGFERTGDVEYTLDKLLLDPEVMTAPVVARVMRRRHQALFQQIVSDQGSIDVLHAHFYSTASHVGGLGVPYVITEHTTVFSRPERASVVRRSARAARRAYAGAFLVMPVSNSLATDLQRHGVGGLMQVIPNPIDMEAFPVRTHANSGEMVRVFCAQRLAVTKGFDTLLHAIAVARRTDNRIALNIAGSGPERGHLDRLVRKLDLTSAVTFLGHLEPAEVAHQMQETDVFAFPSRGDSFGLPAIEALATGVPVVGTPIGILPDVLTPARGIIVPVDDVGALAAALLRMSSSRDSYDPQAIARGIRDRFSIRSVAAQLGQVYANAVG